VLQHAAYLRIILFGSLIVLAARGGAMAFVALPKAVDSARTVYRHDFQQQSRELSDGAVVAPDRQRAGAIDSTRSPAPALAVDPSGKTTVFAADVAVPADMPVALCFDAATTHPGRLIIHLVPAELPKPLAENRPERDWANPAKLYDFRAVVALEPGLWQRHVVDLNHNFFEAVTREKELFDLAGMRIKQIGFELNQPAEADQQVLVANVRVVALTGAAMRVDLESRLSEVKARFAALSAKSPVAEYWGPRLDQLAGRVTAFDEAKPSAEAWRDLAETLQTHLLAARTWQLAPAETRPYLVGVESSLRRVSGRHELFTFRGRPADRVHLESARNEYESFQLVLLPLRGKLENVAVRASDLVHEDLPAKIPASDVAFYHQIEHFIKPSLRTADQQVGWTPDALLPVTGPFHVDDVETKPIWVTVRTPADAAPGVYRGQITVKPASAKPQTVEIALTVHDFAIPRVGRFRTQGHFAISDLQRWYGDKYNDDVRRAYYKLLLEHRFSPTSQYSRMLSPVRDDIPQVMRDGGNVILIGGYHTRDLEPEIIDPAYQWLIENDYIEWAIIYIGDETDDFEGIRNKAAAIRKRWPKLRIMVGGSKPRDELIGYVDVWDPITSGGTVYNFDPQSTRAAQERGEEMFWYTCVGPRPPFANVCNDDPLVAIRALWWQAWQYGVTGFEYWWLNAWRYNYDLAEGDKPWPLSRVEEWNSRTYAWANGDGLLVYPGPDGKALSCNRFSVMRDAIEDWEVLFMLRRAVELAEKDAKPESAAALARAEKLLDVPDHVTTDLTHFSLDPETYLDVRHELYQVLSLLRKTLGPKRVDEYTDKWVADHRRRLQQRFEARVASIRKELESKQP